GDDQFAIGHVGSNDVQSCWIIHPAQAMQHPVFIGNLLPFMCLGKEQRVDSLGGIAVEHKDLAKVRPRGPQEIETVTFGLCQGLLVAINNSFLVVVQPALSDKATSFELLLCPWDEET